MPLDIVLLLTTLPDSGSAQKLVDAVLDARLAACVTELGVVQSHYRWKGQRESAQEIQLLFKTSAARALELERFIAANHPYETPEIVVWPASASAAYGQWVAAETHRPTHV
ncbi:divalent cation tolerance protein [Trinickia caryophylli]|uniref:Divalent cation tolerance protein n=1 Tax=Trinickia caryophylli TaxID=28094 RepID=A0A1X7F689_TRICW|nr:divalent cation tolerance protein [Trinickia caryophylli]SMF46199.1 divalent cation tolerance protein [Trinickia caryophylli]